MAEDADPLITDEENPELTAADFSRAKPFRLVFPEAVASWTQHKQSEHPKVDIAFRLAADVAEGVRASGREYNAKVEKLLRDALAKGLL
jgi:uncharacterized protein (DUF4415 family)